MRVGRRFQLLVWWTQTCLSVCGRARLRGQVMVLIGTWARLQPPCMNAVRVLMRGVCVCARTRVCARARERKREVACVRECVCARARARAHT